MVFTKNSANAFAPSAVCCVASNGMIGGFSPRLMFGPVVGTSLGRVGRVGRGGPEWVTEVVVEVLVGAVLVATEADVEAGSDATAPEEDPLLVGVLPPDDDVQAAVTDSRQPAAINAAIVRIDPTSKSCLIHGLKATVASRSVDKAASIERPPRWAHELSTPTPRAPRTRTSSETGPQRRAGVVPAVWCCSARACDAR